MPLSNVTSGFGRPRLAPLAAAAEPARIKINTFGSLMGWLWFLGFNLT